MTPLPLPLRSRLTVTNVNLLQRVLRRLRHERTRASRAFSPLNRKLRPWIARSETVEGWTRDDEAWALARTSYSLPDNAVVVEAGAFLGSGTILLAGARSLRGSGIVHAIDPFDGSGDEYSTPHYAQIAQGLKRSLRSQFDENMRAAGIESYVRAYSGTAESVAGGWSGPVDLLFLDGDQSPAGAKSAYTAWIPHLKTGGVIALHNSGERVYGEGHDGYHRLAMNELRSPAFTDVRVAGSTTFARRTAAPL